MGGRDNRPAMTGSGSKRVLHQSIVSREAIGHVPVLLFLYFSCFLDCARLLFSEQEIAQVFDT